MMGLYDFWIPLIFTEGQDGVIKGYLNKAIPWHITRWANFKINSGCSKGDYHLTCFDDVWLGNMMYETGFRDIKIFSGVTLAVCGTKPAEEPFGGGERLSPGGDQANLQL